MKAFIVFALVVAVQSTKQYIGDKVYRVTPQDVEELEGLKELFNDFGDKIRFWKNPTVPGRHADIHVNQQDTGTVERFLSKKSIKSKVIIHDVQERVDDQLMSMKRNSKRSDGYTYNHYHTWDEIQLEIYNLAFQYPLKASTFQVGKTYENNDMVGVKVTNGDGQPKPAVWVDGAIHPYEWISPATVMYFLNHIITSEDENVVLLLNRFDVYVLPVFNVDGYIYTYSIPGDRLWRKTRRLVANNCVGVDSNRNWDNHFGGAGTSDDPCSGNYRGDYAFSEVEVKNVADYLAAIPNFVSYFNLHSYGQMLLTPFSYTNESLPVDFDEIMRVGEVFQDTLAGYNTEYIVGPPSFILYPAAGASNDYTYENLGAVYSYGLELPDHGECGYFLPEEEIVPIARQTTHGIIAAALEMKVGDEL